MHGCGSILPRQVVKDCPHSAETALKLRAAFCNGHKMAAKKN
jgi:hypothetical protein